MAIQSVEAKIALPSILKPSGLKKNIVIIKTTGPNINPDFLNVYFNNFQS